MSIWSPTYQENVFKRYHSDKHLLQCYLQDGGKNQLAQMWNKTTSQSPYVSRHANIHIGSTSIALGTTDAVSKLASKWKSLGRCIRPKKRNTIVCATHKSDDRFPTWQSVYYNFGISDVVIRWAASLSGRNAVTWRWSLSNDQRVTVDRVSL